MYTTNYTDTLITVSPDCPAEEGLAPPRPGTVAALQYELLMAHPYGMTSDDLYVAVAAARRGADASGHDAIRAELFAKPQACMRASPLVKTYGWGVHHDGDGRVALVGRGSAAYEKLAGDTQVKKVAGMRSRRV